jgi:fucose 4-O-acetylase-like acetyltransferase
MSEFTSWWEGLTLSLKIYWALAIPFTVFFILQLILSFFGGDVPDDTPDNEVEADTGIAFQFFTLKNLIAFFSIFGWTGIACIDSGLSETTSLIIAVMAGLIMMTIMASIFYFLGKASANGTLQMKNAVGGIGEVYLTIKGKRGGIGKVQITVQGSLRTLDAMTDDEVDIPTGNVITVTQVLNETILLVTAK